MQTTLSATNDVYCAAIQKQHNYDTGLRIWPKQCQGEPPVKYQRSLCSIMIVPNPDRCSYCSFHFFALNGGCKTKITGIYGHWKHHNPVSIQVSSCDGNVAKTGSLRSVMQWLLCCQLAARKARIKVRCSGDATNKLVSEQVLYPTGDFFHHCLGFSCRRESAPWSRAIIGYATLQRHSISTHLIVISD